VICVEIKSGLFTLVRIAVESEAKTNPPKRQLSIKDLIQAPAPEDDLSTAVEKIKGILKDKGLKNNPVTIIISESDVFLKKIYIPVMPPNEIKKAVVWQAPSLLPYDLGKCIFNYKVIGRQKDREGKEKTAVLLGAMEKEKAEKIADFISRIGLLPVHFIHPVTALELLLGLSSTGEEPVLFLDSGPETSRLRVYKEAKFQFERLLELGEKDLDAALMNTGVSADRLDYFKKEYGMPTIEDMDKAGTENIPVADMGRQARVFVEKLTIELRRALKQWVEEYQTGVVDMKMYLLGNLAHFRHLSTYLSNELGLEVTLANPSSLGLQVVNAQDSAEIDITRLGYCLGGSLYKAEELDFLPLALKFRNKLERVKAGVRISLAATAASMLLLYLITQSYSFILNNNIKNKKSELTRLKNAGTEFATFQKTEQRLFRQLAFYYSISGNQPLLTGVMKELTNIIPAGIIFEKLTLDGETLLLEGITRPSADNTPEASLSRFMKEIESSPFFQGAFLVDLKEYSGKGTGGRYAKSFSIQTYLRRLPLEKVLE